MPEVARVLSLIQEHAARLVDLRFVDLAGRQRHVAIEASAVDAQRLQGGVLIDGSALPGWREVTEADLLLQPDPATAWLDPFAAQPTVAIVANVVEPGTLLGYERDPRSALLRAAARLKALRAADEARIGIDLAFWILDDVRFEDAPGRQGASLRGGELRADSAQIYAAGNPGHRPLPRGGYAASHPADQTAELRAEITSVLAGLGIAGITHRHGRAQGQHLLQLPACGLVEAADRLVLAKSTIHQVAASYGKTATFLAKPLADEAGAGLGLAVSLWAQGKPVFAGTDYADLSPLCLQFVGGILRHARAISAFTNPTTNSWRRLRRGEDEPTLLAYAAHNRSAAIRIPYAQHPTGKRIELRFPDPTAHPYLALAAILQAGLDGIASRQDPGEPIDRNLYDLPAPDPAELPALPRDLSEALGWLETDQEFLAEAEVVPRALIDAYLRHKRAEIAQVEAIPHPAELQLYLGL